MYNLPPNWQKMTIAIIIATMMMLKLGISGSNSASVGYKFSTKEVGLLKRNINKLANPLVKKSIIL